MRVSGIAAWSLLTAIAATEAFVPSEPNGRVGGARRRLAPRRRLLPAPASADPSPLPTGSLDPPAPAEPWRADYRTSLATQDIIKAAGGDSRSGGGGGGRGRGRGRGRGQGGRDPGARGRGRGRGPGQASPLQRASDVLGTLLDTPPELCNAANLVCALTMSAKLVNGISPGGRGWDEFRDRRDRALVVLGELVAADCLTPRQLCNSAWAVGRHRGFDGSILPGVDMIELGGRERWDLTRDAEDGGALGGKGAQRRLSLTMDAIAARLTMVLRDPDSPVVKPGELSMAVWAYASVRPRNVPPGWELPPRVGRVTSPSSSSSSSSSSFSSGAGAAAAAAAAAAAGGPSPASDDAAAAADEDVITFERWDETSASGASHATGAGRDREGSRSEKMTDALFDAVAVALCREGTDIRGPLLRRCPWKELATVAWAFATRGHHGSKPSEMLIMELVDEGSRRLEEAPRGAKKISGGDRAHSGSRHVQSEGDERLSRFIPRDVAQLAWAVGILQSDNYKLGDSLVQFTEAIGRHYLPAGDGNSNAAGPGRPLEKWQTADLVQLAVAMSHGRIDDSGLLSEVYAEALQIMAASERAEKDGGRDHRRGQRHRKARKWQSFELSIMLWVQANLYLTSKQAEAFATFAEAMPRAILRRMEQATGTGAPEASVELIGLGPQEQANLAWSLTVLDDHTSGEADAVLGSIFRAASSHYTSGTYIRLENAHQLWQALYLLEDGRPECVADVGPAFREYLESTWSAEKSRGKVSSARHKALSTTLGLMRVAHYNEHDEDIDVAIILKEDSSWTNSASADGPGTCDTDGTDCHHKVAVEFDGPAHFTRIVPGAGGGGRKPRALGHTVLKYRILKRQGWSVVRVPYYEWDKIPHFASMERQRYLQRMLKTHREVEFSKADVSEYKPMVPNRQTRFD